MENRITELRKEKGLTLKQLGEILNIRDNTLSQYETGKRNPQLGLLQEIANLFNVSIEYLTKATDKRDYPIDSDEDAIVLIEKINSKELTHFDFSNKTALNLAIWILTNIDTLKQEKAYSHLVDTAIQFINTVSSQNIVLDKYNSYRKKENAIIDKIDEKLILDEDYYGASPKQVLRFIELSEKIDYEYIDKILDSMVTIQSDDTDQDIK